MTPALRPRFDVVDWLRGLVMVLMALDHTRDFVGDFSTPALDPARSYPALFFIRWITHYCAPVFVFLTGVSAYLFRTRGRTTGQLAAYLFTRGLWLVVLEFTLVFICWDVYQPKFHNLRIQVIGAIGFGMMFLAAFVWLPRWVVGVLGLAIVCGHNTLESVVPGDFGQWAWLWRLLHDSGPIEWMTGWRVWVAYPILPWIGVMACGYAAGPVAAMERANRRPRMILAGVICVALFVLLRVTNIYGDPRPWPPQTEPARTVMAILNCEKYPPSLAYVLMTLGPALLLAAAADRASGPPLKWIVTIGRVPMLFYLIHLPVIHAFAGSIFLYGRSQGWYPPLEELMKSGGQGGLKLPLWGVYLVWVGVVFVLYFPCRWFAGVKQRTKSVWLSYL